MANKMLYLHTGQTSLLSIVLILSMWNSNLSVLGPPLAVPRCSPSLTRVIPSMEFNPWEI